MRKFYKKMTVVLILLFTKVFFAQAFTENFDDITTLTGSGWYQQNNSNPAGITPVWFQETLHPMVVLLRPITEQLTPISLVIIIVYLERELSATGL